MAGDSARAFLERARLEADRYGPDPWIFARELLQNARDAGASVVRFAVYADAATDEEVVICQDDGEGMTFEHARRYLFALYASSKENAKNQAGKFGVGFWSVLRYEPSAILIRSWPRQGQPWGLCLDGSLDTVAPSAPPAALGTEIILRRPRGDGGLERRIFDAVWQSARYLGQRDDPDTPLPIEINGRPANAAFALPAPSATFRRRRLRGVVGLGTAPRVELFSRGLRVRSAACLEDLLSPAGRHSGWMRVRFSELPGGVAPVALLESAELELMLARSDARETRSLERLVRLAQREQQRLIERQLSMSRPLPFFSALGAWLAERIRLVSLVPVLAGMVLLFGVLVFLRLGEGGAPSGPRSTARLPAEVTLEAATSDEGPAVDVVEGPRAFDDLGERYQGPDVEDLVPDAALTSTLQYAPSEGRHHFAALRFARLEPDGSPVRQALAVPAAAYPAVTCAANTCLDIALSLRARAPAVRIPVPTGHRVVAGSVELEHHRPRLRASADGHPVVVFDAPAEGLLRYRTAPAADRTPAFVPAPPAELPPELARAARRLRRLAVPARVVRLLALVRRRVVYDRSSSTRDRHRQALAQNQGFLARTLGIGKGDCDVQNGLLTALLHAAGVPARLAVGYLGVNGRVLPWMHAWVEYQHQQRWQVADATLPGRGGRASEEVVVGAGLAPEEVAPSPAAALEPPVEAALQMGSEAELAALAPEPGEESADAPQMMTGATEPAAKELSRPARPLVAIGLFCLLAGLLLAFATRTRRDFELDARADLSKLLLGVLQQPEAFGHIGALFYRPLIPLFGGKALSLLRARDLARRGRLYATREASSLANSAVRAGATVIDCRLAEGRTVADALGAVDLDRWGRLLHAAQDEPLFFEVNRRLRRHGEAFRVQSARVLEEEIAVLDLGPLGRRVWRPRAKRLVLLGASAPWLAEARAEHALRPQAAALLVLDRLARRLDIPPARRRRLLGESAQAAILESFGPGSAAGSS